VPGERGLDDVERPSPVFGHPAGLGNRVEQEPDELRPPEPGGRSSGVHPSVLARLGFAHRHALDDEKPGADPRHDYTPSMTAGPLRLRLRVVPGARRSGVVGRYGEAWKVRVSALPEGGAANAALVRLLAETAGVPARDVAVVAGHTGRDKIVELAGISASELENRLAAAERKDLRP